MPTHFDDLHKARMQRAAIEEAARKQREQKSKEYGDAKTKRETVIRNYHMMVMQVLIDFSHALGYGGEPIFKNMFNNGTDSYWEFQCKEPYIVGEERDSYYQFRIWVEFDSQNNPTCFQCEREGRYYIVQQKKFMGKFKMGYEKKLVISPVQQAAFNRNSLATALTYLVSLG